MKIKPHALKLNINVPSSKSYLHRALICAALCGNNCVIHNVYFSQDIKATFNGLIELGWDFEINDSDIISKGYRKKENFVPLIDCKESASTIRFLIPFSLCFYEECNFKMGESLAKRPLEEYYKIFESQNIKYKLENNVLKIKGNLKSGNFLLQGDISSQFVSGLLMSLPILKGDSYIVLDNFPVSKSYIDITLDVLKNFGISIVYGDKVYIKGNQNYVCNEYFPPGDWSAGAFWHILKICHNIKLNNLDYDNPQSDKVIIKLLNNLPEKWSCRNAPDLVPCLVAYLIATNQEITILDCERLKYKESDRLNGLKEFKKLGGNIEIYDDKIVIRKSEKLQSGFVKTFNDHRLIMAFAVFAYLTNLEIEIDESEGIKKSYPELFQILGEIQ